jgi:hypothetical protein
MSGTTIKVNAVEAKVPKMNDQARLEKIGSSVITADLTSEREPARDEAGHERADASEELMAGARVVRA